ncbi:hypothetical protein Tco_0921525 [Tanacetum coccineum]
MTVNTPRPIFRLPTQFRGCYSLGIKSQGYREPDSVMSDSDESGVTHTEISSPFEDLSDIGSPRADDQELLEPPYMLEDPFKRTLSYGTTFSRLCAWPGGA